MPKTMAKRLISHTEISMRVKGIIADKIGRPPAELGDCAEVGRLNLDSLDEVVIVMAVEESFDIDLDFADISRAATVGQFVDLVEGAVGGMA